MPARAIALVLVALAGCGGGDDGPAAADATTAAPDGEAAPTWDGFAEPFFAAYCHECHGPGDPLRDFSQLAMVRAEAEVIRCGVAARTQDGCAGSVPARQFPIGDGPLPSDAERDRIVAWIDDGAPE
jgi:hypothetical protein